MKIVGLLLVALTTACGGGGGSPGTTTGSSSPTVQLLRVAAPAEISLLPGASASFPISGGQAPYSVTVDNSSVVQASVSASNDVTVGAVADGQAKVQVRDARSNLAEFTVKVLSPPVVALFTTAPSALTLLPGVNQNFSIKGGKIPYSVSSNRPSIAIGSISGTVFQISSILTGAAKLRINDADGKTIEVDVTVQAAGGDLAVTPNSGSISTSDQILTTISGGVSPYRVVVGNASIANASIRNSNQVLISPVKAGTTTITVFDSENKIVVYSLAVTEVAVDLFTTAPATVNLTPASNQTFSVVGGKPPYTVSSDKISVASATISGSTLQINGLVTGSSNIRIVDALGAPLNVTVVVASSGGTLAVLPNSGSISTSDQILATISGGVPPYRVVTENISIANATIRNSNQVIISPIKAGATTITILDSENKIVVYSLNVTEVAVGLFTTAPATVNLAPASNQTFSVVGGKPPYTVSSDRLSVVGATISGSILQINGVSTGSASIRIVDSLGVSINVAVVVAASGGALAILPTSGSVRIPDQITAGISGGVPPYRATVINTSIANVIINSQNQLVINPLKIGATTINVFDAENKVVTYTLTTTGIALAVSPSTASTFIDVPAQVVITGGTPPYRVTPGIPGVFRASISGDIMTVTPTLASSSLAISVFDQDNNSIIFTLTGLASQPSIRLSPNTLTVSERDTQDIVFTVFGATGAITAFSSDTNLLSAAVSGNTVTVKTGSQTTRCVAADTDVIVTVIDSTRASATAVVTLKDNAVCP